MSVIRASVTDQRLKITEAPVLASGGLNETKVAFTFCEKWTGFTKTATFYRDESVVYSIPLDANDTCVVPWEVCNESGTFYIGVFGDKDNVRRTSTTVRYRVKNGAITEGSSPSEPTPDRYAQLAGEVESLASELHEHIENCGTTDTDSVFYGNLADAVAEQNAVADSTALVEVFTAENGEKIVRLLADVSESASIDITRDMTLVLNGHTLHITTAEAWLNFYGNCTINGEVAGSAIKKEGVTGTSSLSNCITVNAKGVKFKAVGGVYTLKGSFAKQAMCFRVDSACQEFVLDGATVNVENTKATASAAKGIQSQGANTILRNTSFTAHSQGKSTAVHIVSANGTAEISNCNIASVTTVDATGVQSVAVDMTATYKVENSTITASGYVAGAILSKGQGNIEKSTITASGFKANGVENNSNAVVTNSKIFTDAHSGHVDDASTAIGIMSKSTAVITCVDTDVTGTHSAVQSSGDLFVKGGIFSGYAHGGFYLIHGTENKAYINNATMRFGVYEGSFADFSASALAGFYMGLDSLDSPGISVYMDGCTIEGQGGEPFVVRAGAEGKTNTLYVSNTVNNATTTSPIRLNKDQTTNRAEMKIGANCNFTPADTCNPAYAEETGKLYRRIKEDMPVDARDLNALIAMH